jgi:putative tryptophan/tyrosine transport system substrate-binding protein
MQYWHFRNMKRRDFIKIITGSAGTVWPHALSAQQTVAPVIGFMSSRAAEDSAQIVAAFRQGLGETGFVEGQNITIEYRWARGDYDLLPALVMDLVGRGVVLLVALGGDTSPLAAKKAAVAIPVVFGMGGDPVRAGIVASFNRPGGNFTGFTVWTNRMEAKRLSLVRELVPGTSLVGVLVNPRFPPTEQELEDIQLAAKAVNQRMFMASANDDAEMDVALNSFTQRGVGAFLVTAAPFFDTRLNRIVEFAAQNRLPGLYHFREYAIAGGLMSYGPNVAESYHDAGAYVGRILRGAKPADLPVLQPTKFDFVVNLKAAHALGLTVPPTLLAQASEVIE